MDKKEDAVLDKLAGCLLGLALGDSLGMPARDMSPYDVWRNFQNIDAFYPCRRTKAKAGSYTGVTQLTMLEALALAESGGEPDPARSARALKDVKSNGRARWLKKDWPLRCLPWGLLAIVHPRSDKDLLEDCIRACSVSKKSPKEVLASFSVAWAVKELARNGDSMRDVGELCLADLSMMGRLVTLCQKVEARFENDTDKLWQRLDYVRRKIDDGASPETFAGTVGNSWDVAESVPFSMFCFLRGPDDIASVRTAATMGRASSLNAAITGALVGAYAGVSFIPAETRNALEGSAKIIQLARRLASMAPETEDAADPEAGI